MKSGSVQKEKNGLENKWSAYATSEEPTTADFTATNWKTEVKIQRDPPQICVHCILLKANIMNFKIKISPLKNKGLKLSSVKYTILYCIFLEIKTYFIKNCQYRLINRWPCMKQNRAKYTRRCIIYSHDIFYDN